MNDNDRFASSGRTVLAGELGEGTAFRLIVAGSFTERELDRLMELLTTRRRWIVFDAKAAYDAVGKPFPGELEAG
jgi:hypothetical protein